VSAAPGISLAGFDGPISLGQRVALAFCDRYLAGRVRGVYLGGDSGTEPLVDMDLDEPLMIGARRHDHMHGCSLRDLVPLPAQGVLMRAERVALFAQLVDAIPAALGAGGVELIVGEPDEQRLTVEVTAGELRFLRATLARLGGAA
jgi:hypothetical protein